MSILKDINANAEPYVAIEEGVVSKVRATNLNDDDNVKTYSSCGIPFLRKYDYEVPNIKCSCDKEVPYKIKNIPWKKNK